MYQHTGCADDVDWQALDFAGVSMRVLVQDREAGTMTVMTRLEPGATIPAHWHSRAGETVFVLEGVLIENGREHPAGSFLAGRAGTSHGPHATESGCVLLTTFSADLDFHLCSNDPAPYDHME